MNKWYKLDNAAKLFPLVTSRRNSSVFRVSAVLNEEIDRDILQKAVDYVHDRYPIIFVKMRKGVFWHYFDSNNDKLLIQEEKDTPCKAINPYENNNYLLRILFFNKRISIEMFHALSDGGGAIELLKTILFYYFNFLYDTHMDSEDKVLLADDGASIDDLEDSFLINYADSTDSNQEIKKNKRSFKIKGTKYETYGTNVTTGIISASELNQLAKLKNATITSYLVAVLIYSIYTTRQKLTNDKKPITVGIPVNLRKIFLSRTHRNFFAVIKVGMAVDATTKIDDIIDEITRQLKLQTEKPMLLQIMKSKIKIEKLLISRVVPLFLKKLFVTIRYNVIDEAITTIQISNLGNLSVPTGFSTKLNLIEAILYPTIGCPLNCGICSVNDKLAISFSRTIIETDIIKFFFHYLSEKSAENGGLEVAVYSNDWGDQSYE